MAIFAILAIQGLALFCDPLWPLFQLENVDKANFYERARQSLERNQNCEVIKFSVTRKPIAWMQDS